MRVRWWSRPKVVLADVDLRSNIFSAGCWIHVCLGYGIVLDLFVLLKGWRF